jgi:uncharacterized protein YqgV (UPF0045/DUF77 family)
MGTCIEGEYDEVMSVVKRCLEDMRLRHNRVTFQIKADDRKGAAGRLEGKIASVEAKAGRKFRS